MPDVEDTRERIVAAAVEIIAEDGLDALTVDRVADAAGVDDADLRACVTGRDELIAVTMQDRGAAMAERREAHLDDAGDEPARAMAAFLEEEMETAAADLDGTVAGLEMLFAGVRNPDLAAESRGWGENARAHIEAITDPTTAWALHAAGLGAVLESLVGEEVPPRHQIEELYRRLLVTGPGAG